MLKIVQAIFVLNNNTIILKISSKRRIGGQSNRDRHLSIQKKSKTKYKSYLCHIQPPVQLFETDQHTPQLAFHTLRVLLRLRAQLSTLHTAHLHIRQQHVHLTLDRVKHLTVLGLHQLLLKSFNREHDLTRALQEAVEVGLQLVGLAAQEVGPVVDASLDYSDLLFDLPDLGMRR